MGTMTNGRISRIAPRLDEKPWGGRRLTDYGLELPPDARIGEALVTVDDAVIAAGFGAGRTLGEVVRNDPERFAGRDGLRATGGRAMFPLLVKLIDAAENLSIQVHPNDAQAAPLDSLGKSEAWYVLRAEPGALLYLGLRDGVNLDRFMRDAGRLDGASAPLLRALPAVSGETWMIPAGTIHALGAGVMVYEIQQPSAVTYRLDDWGRVDRDGNPREVHLEQGRAVAVADSRPEPQPPSVLEDDAIRQTRMVASDWFELVRIDATTGGIASLGSPGSPEALTLLEGGAQIDNGDTAIDLRPGESAVIWPGEPANVAFTRGSVALRGRVPEEGAIPTL